MSTVTVWKMLRILYARISRNKHAVEGILDYTRAAITSQSSMDNRLRRTVVLFDLAVNLIPQHTMETATRNHTTVRTTAVFEPCSGLGIVEGVYGLLKRESCSKWKKYKGCLTIYGGHGVKTLKASLKEAPAWSRSVEMIEINETKSPWVVVG